MPDRSRGASSRSGSLPSRRSRRLVDRDVPGHDQVRVPGEDDDGRVDAARLELVELAEQHLGVDDAAGADHRRLAGDDPARNLADLERLAAGDDRVPRVRPALVAADDVRALRQQVDDLALPLVAPLRADDDGRGHVSESADAAAVRRAPRLPRRLERAIDSPHDDPVAASARRERRHRASPERAAHLCVPNRDDSRVCRHTSQTAS